MSMAQLNLAFVVGLPLGVVLAMIFWPSDYDDPPGPGRPD